MQRWGVETVFGGQSVDYALLNRMTVALNVYDAIKAVRSAVGEAIHRIPRSQLAIIDMLAQEQLFHP